MRLVREHVAIAAAILWLAACIEVTRAQQGPDVQPPSQGSNASQRPDSLPPMPPNARSQRKPEGETPTPFMLPSTSGSTERTAPTREGTPPGQGTPQSPAELGIEMQAPKAADKEAWGQEAAPESVRTQTNDNPTGRQEPAVSLEWIGPPTAKIGQTITYQIMVKNVSAAPVSGVLVRNRLSAGV